jgi:hypothetical protein
MIEALAVDGDQLRPFVEADHKLWFPTPPASPR